jgi:hypothetical protein
MKNDRRGNAAGNIYSFGCWDENCECQSVEWADHSTTATNKVSNEFISAVWDIMDSAGNLLLNKQADYGPKNISDAPGGPLNGLRVRMHDKIARINNLIDNEFEPENESLRDSFIDLLNYSAIAMMVLDGNWPSE